MNQEEKDKLFKDVANHVADLVIKKNHDYGDSFHEVYEEFGDLSTLIRLTDKMKRLRNIVSGNEMLIAGESLDDVYEDIAGYCILTLSSITRLEEE